MDAMTTNTTTTELAAPLRGVLLEIGQLTFHVYGNARMGWSVVRRDIMYATPYRYGTLEELVFALLNYTLVEPGEA